MPSKEQWAFTCHNKKASCNLCLYITLSLFLFVYFSLRKFDVDWENWRNIPCPSVDTDNIISNMNGIKTIPRFTVKIRFPEVHREVHFPCPATSLQSSSRWQADIAVRLYQAKCSQTHLSSDSMGLLHNVGYWWESLTTVCSNPH